MYADTTPGYWNSAMPTYHFSLSDVVGKFTVTETVRFILR